MALCMPSTGGVYCCILHDVSYAARVMMVLKPPIHCNENSNSNMICVQSSVYTFISFQL